MRPASGGPAPDGQVLPRWTESPDFQRAIPASWAADSAIIASLLMSGCWSGVVMRHRRPASSRMTATREGSTPFTSGADFEFLSTA